MDQLCLSTSVAADAPQPRRLDSRQVAPGEVPPRGVLVVDDDAAILLLLEIALRERGFTVWKAANGEDALALYRLHRGEIVLVLLDVRMPILDGPQTAAALRQLEPELCFCFMSGHSGPYRHEQLLELGAARVFDKPFKLAELLRTIDRLAEESQVGR